ncbi:MAG TPA: cellulase family glycosylhydrolase, partial [Alteraurantiacibacter sp.]
PAGLDVDDTRTAIAEWQAAQRGTPRDLQAFYRRVIAAIREVDPLTPIMVDAGIYADTQSLAVWDGPLADPRVLYAVHMYTPWEATSLPNQRAGFTRRYPGFEADYEGRRLVWNREAVDAHLSLAFEWAGEHGLPPGRVVVSEFGCLRRWPDCAAYLGDVISAIDRRDGHWAFYTFRPDEWDGMDYELPPSVTPGQYYWRKERGTMDALPRDGSLMELIKRRLSPNDD